VLGDRRQLVSALSALLENSVLYSPSGGTVTLDATIGQDTAAEHDEGPS